MRWTVWILLLFAFIFLLSGFAVLSCEETLEVCPACGEIADGNSEIIGDPRIDTTFQAVQNLRDETIRMSLRANASLFGLMKVFDAAPEGGETEMDALARAVGDFVSAAQNPPFEAAVTFGACSVDRRAADRAQNICEKRLCNLDNPSTVGLCRGWSKGSCVEPAAGICFRPSSGTCPGDCAGTCDRVSAVPCPGNCFGSCDAPCLAHDENGSCSGICTGNCTGICFSETAFACDGQCSGACGDNDADAGCDDTDTFAGACDEVAENADCRGHYYPEGCGTKCRGCAETAADCRESAKFSAWSQTRCTAADLRVTPFFNSDNPDVTAVEKIQALERYLAPIANDYAWLSLLLEGTDARSNTHLGEALKSTEDGSLDKDAAKYYDYSSLNSNELPPVDLNRAYLPLEALKARIYWLLRVSMNSSGGYQITAGNFDCLEPALNEAASLLLSMVPVIREQDSDGSVSFSANTTCTALEPPLDAAVPCLYELLKRQADLLALVVTPDSPQ